MASSPRPIAIPDCLRLSPRRAPPECARGSGERAMRAGLEFRALLATAALVSACSTGSEPSGGPGLNVLSGAGTTDTIGAELRSPLVIRVLDDAGRPLAGEYLVLESRDCP